MANTFKFGNGQWAVGKETALAYNDENNNFKPLPFSFDRGSIATVVNKNGLIETVGVDEPRIDFLNNPKGHLLLEPQRRNEVTYSEDLSEWTTTDLSITSNSLVSPDGTQNADKVTATANFARLQYTYTLSASTTYTISFYVKNISAVNPRVQVYDNTNATNLLNTYYGSELTGEWKKLTYSFTTTTGTSILVRPVRDLNNAEEMYIWGIQLEEGSYATSYIPTSGSAVTRSAESCYNQPPSGVIGQTELTLFYQGIVEYSSSDGHAITLSQGLDGSGSERMLLYRQSDGDVYFYIIDGTTQFSTPLLVNSNPQYNDKYAIAIKQNDLVIYCNGEKAAENNSGTLPSIQYVYLNEWSNLINHQNKIIDVRLYNTRLSNSELQALTTI